MTDTPQVLLAHHLKALKLPTILREYDKVARACAAEGVDYRAVRKLDKALFQQLATGRWIAEHRNLLITGPCEPAS